VHPQKESYWGRVNPVGIRSCYDEGKRAAECLMMDYRRQNAVNAKIVRIFNTYGPRMAVNDGRVVSNFIIQALQGKNINVYGNGNHTRSFCYCDDLIDGLIKMMNSADDFFGPVNIGNPDEFSILQLARMIIDLTGGSSKIDFQPLPADDPTQRKPDITLAQKKLGWQPKIALEQGLVTTIQYFRDTLKIS
jgi:UDP-glucuronate decarboxylase